MRAISCCVFFVYCATVNEFGKRFSQQDRIPGAQKCILVFSSVCNYPRVYLTNIILLLDTRKMALIFTGFIRVLRGDLKEKDH